MPPFKACGEFALQFSLAPVHAVCMVMSTDQNWVGWGHFYAA